MREATVAGLWPAPLDLCGQARPDLLVKLSIFAVLLTVPAVSVGSYFWGSIGTAAGLSAATLVSVTVNVAVVMRQIRSKWSDLGRNLWRPWSAVIVMSVAVIGYATSASVPITNIDRLGQLAILVAIGIVAFVGSQFGFWLLSGRPDGAEKYILATLRALSSGNVGRSNA